MIIIRNKYKKLRYRILFNTNLDTIPSSKSYLFANDDKCCSKGATNDEGLLMVPDHDLLNEYYEYALKSRIFENLFLNGEDVSQRMQLVEQRLKAARNQALSLVNTPNFRELEKMWLTNRKAMYGKFYDMFKSYPPNSSFYGYSRNNRVI